MLYVDKTEYIYNLIKPTRCLFLSRPRRFGKSILLGTMVELFKDNRDLFKGLWIDSSDYKFEKFPVVHLNMSGNFETVELTRNAIVTELKTAAISNGLPDIGGSTPAEILKMLVTTLVQKTGKNVVVLIDEYDEPIRSEINNLDQAQRNRKELHAFYSALKSLSDKSFLHFLFVTGVTKFAQTSVFSVFNNLYDITMTAKYNGICGFTLEEFDSYFEDHLHQILEIFKNESIFPKYSTIDELKTMVLKYYDGYSWDGLDRVLNPFSLIQFFEQKKFAKFWFNSATPTFLYEYIIRHPEDFTTAKEYIFTEEMFSPVEVGQLDLVNLFFQTGYLTIDHAIEGETINVKNLDQIDPERSNKKFLLKIPNLEVENALNSQLLKYLTGKTRYNLNSLVPFIRKALADYDSTLLASALSQILTWVSYQEQPKTEKYHHAIIAIALKAMNFNFTSEISSPEAIFDFKLEFPPDTIIVGEFKYAKLNAAPVKTIEQRRQRQLKNTVKLAESQIINRRYAKIYFGKDTKVKCLAIGIVGRTDVAVKFFDRPNEWEFQYKNDI